MKQSKHIFLAVAVVTLIAPGIAQADAGDEVAAAAETPPAAATITPPTATAAPDNELVDCYYETNRYLSACQANDVVAAVRE
jgi:hypothetical protein